MSRLHASSRQLTGQVSRRSHSDVTRTWAPPSEGDADPRRRPGGGRRGTGRRVRARGRRRRRREGEPRVADGRRRPPAHHHGVRGHLRKVKFPDEPVRSPGGRIIKRHPWKTAWSTGAWRRPPPSAPRGATPASTPADDEPAGATMEDRGGEREPAVASPSPSRSPSPASLVGRLAARRRRRAATPSDSEPVMSFESESNSDRSDVENESDLELANAPGLDFGRSPW